MNGELDAIRARTPGQAPIRWRESRVVWIPLACLLGAAWPPVVLTLPLLPPHNWMPGLAMDWRLVVFVVALVTVPVGLWAVARERERTQRPATRLGVVWRFLLYGGLFTAALETLLVIVLVVINWAEAGTIGQSLGAAETTLLIYGVAGLPVAMLIGVSYALWAGLCVALIAFQPRPPAVRSRLGIIEE
jgi:hypothetical protein